MDFYLPTLTDSFLKGQDLLYKQFNDVEFYIEDTEQENLYFHILKKIFPDIKFEKIFPLNGKKNVKDDCLLNSGNKTKIYIVDKDFDDILNKIEELPNLFYLNSYSIENLLISKYAVYELIKERSPKLKNDNIDQLYSHTDLIKKISCLKELSTIFVVIQEYELGELYYNINTIRDFNINSDFSYRGNFIFDYKVKIELALKGLDKRYTLNAKSKIQNKHFSNINLQLKNIPGKHLLCVINDILKSKNLIHQYSIESLTYKLAKEADISNFNDLKNNILEYVNN